MRNARTPDPPARVADRRAAIEALGERLGDGVARHLTVSGEGENGAPQALPVLPVEAIQLFIGLHTPHRIPLLYPSRGPEGAERVGSGSALADLSALEGVYL